VCVLVCMVCVCVCVRERERERERESGEAARNMILVFEALSYYTSV
jgi:hypothetical protein